MILLLKLCLEEITFSIKLNLVLNAMYAPIETPAMENIET